MVPVYWFGSDKIDFFSIQILFFLVLRMGVEAPIGVYINLQISILPYKAAIELIGVVLV